MGMPFFTVTAFFSSFLKFCTVGLLVHAVHTHTHTHTHTYTQPHAYAQTMIHIYTDAYCTYVFNIDIDTINPLALMHFHTDTQPRSWGQLVGT